MMVERQRGYRPGEHRFKAEQLPARVEDRAMMISMIHKLIADQPHDVERCAAALARMTQPDIVTIDLTCRSRDGIGGLTLSPQGISIAVRA
jgi:chemotaxis response regulator CheB